MFKVTFYYWSELLNKGFENVEIHTTRMNAELRASALNWTIIKVERIPQ